MHTTPPSIFIKNAHLHYPQQTIFAGLNLTLPASKITCVLGPSGVGKTSLLRLVAGFKKIDSHTKLTASIFTDDERPLTGRIAYLAQTDLLFPWLNVIDNVLAGFRIRQINKSAKENLYACAAKLLEDVGLTAATTKKTFQLSGGMRQRVALARTLMEDRPVVLMDEPFSSLDIVTRMKLQELSAQLLQEKTVLLITHDPLEALRMGQQILVLAGSPAKIIARHIIDTPVPRPANDPDLLIMQAELIEQLIQTPS